MDKWISVKDRLPEDDLPKTAKQVKVLTAIKGKSGYAVRSQLRWKNYYGDWVWRYSAGEVTHWMPLPEPPKEDTHD